MKSNECRINSTVYVPKFGTSGVITAKMGYMIRVRLDSSGELLWLHPAICERPSTAKGLVHVR